LPTALRNRVADAVLEDECQTRLPKRLLEENPINRVIRSREAIVVGNVNMRNLGVVESLCFERVETCAREDVAFDVKVQVFLPTVNSCWPLARS
jgi:hypothetical protein